MPAPTTVSGLFLLGLGVPWDLGTYGFGCHSQGWTLPGRPDRTDRHLLAVPADRPPPALAIPGFKVFLGYPGPDEKEYV